jgi:thiosulfate/3-mercaptopyruvate sulfurtransferase
VLSANVRVYGLPVSDVLIDTEGLAAALDGADPPVLLDVRWALGEPDGRAHHLAGHIPGSVYVDLDTELAAPAGAGGRHPLPAVADLQAAARRWGIGTDSWVVAYDNANGWGAARAWWLLRWAGVADVRILDGGYGAWLAAERHVDIGEPDPPDPGDVELLGGQLRVLDTSAAAELARTGVLLDARAGERYRGEVEPVDPRPGHIPGAISAPAAALTEAGTYRPAADLRAHFAALGADATTPVGAYCGSGVSAAQELAALAIAGIDAALYVGSWSAWSADPSRPAATGPDPG